MLIIHISCFPQNDFFEEANILHNHIISIAEELKYLDDIVPPNISGVLAIQRDLNFNRDRRIFLLNNHPNLIKEMMRRRIEVISFKNSEDKRKKQADFVKEFIKKYPKWDNIISKQLRIYDFR